MPRLTKYLLTCLLLLLPGRISAQVVAYPEVKEPVALAYGLTGDELTILSAHVVAADQGAELLLDSPLIRPYLDHFLSLNAKRRVIPVGRVSNESGHWTKLQGATREDLLPWTSGHPEALWDSWFPQAQRVVVCPSEPRGQFLQAACLAGAIRAPLFVPRGDEGDKGVLIRRLTSWRTKEVFAVGPISMELCRGIPKVRLRKLEGEAETAEAYLKHQARKGRLEVLVVANPFDTSGPDSMSQLAPWIALRRRAALLLTNAKGSNTSTLVKSALERPELARADAMILVAHPRAIPVEQRPNPVEGKDAMIEMEPFTPTGTEPFTLSTGRLFHNEPGLVALLLARERLLRSATGPRRALVASNPGGGLPLLETFSRHTAREFRSRGYETTALFENQVEKNLLRRLLPEQDIFLWEGHHKTMVEEFELPTWKEPLRPALVVLQSCLALNEEEAFPLLRRGAVGVIGSSTRTYSGSGGAFTLCFFDALMYENQSLGGALRQAKNYLLAYSLLKQKRLGGDAKLTGANLRSAWAFSLWGDPTLKLPRPPIPDHAPAGVSHHVVRDRTIVLTTPEKTYEPVKSEKFQAAMWPNARLAGLLTRDEEQENLRHLVPLLFAEVALPRAPAGKLPRLSSRLSSRNWVFLWDGRRACGYLLVRPPSGEQREFRFNIHWETQE